jgi:hypothetical protein
MEAGWAWLGAVDFVVLYADLGISKGMSAGVARAREAGVPVQVRSIR